MTEPLHTDDPQREGNVTAEQYYDDMRRLADSGEGELHEIPEQDMLHAIRQISTSRGRTE